MSAAIKGHILRELAGLLRGYGDSDPAPGPDHEAILVLHGHQDGYIPLAVGSEETFLPMIASRSRDLEDVFAQRRERISKDAYVGINAAYRTARHRSTVPDRPAHRTDTLRYLCACYVDLDFYKIPALKGDFGLVAARLEACECAGVIPAPSIIVSSGRGIWLLFMLRDAKDSSRPQHAWPEKVALYGEVQRRLAARLADLGADLAANDAARYVRVPGSFHTGAEEIVRWFVARDTNGDVPTYTLSELATLVGLQPARAKHRRNGRPACPEANKAKRRGWEALQQRRLREMEKLRKLRGGFPEGCRHYGLMVYAWLLRCNCIAQPEATRLVNAMAAECRPPPPAADARSAVKTGFGKRILKLRDQTISDWLAITPEESAQLERLSPAAHFGGSARAEPEHRAAMPNLQARRAHISELIGRLGQVPPTRTVVRLLAQQGVKVSHVTVASDYKAMGISVSR